MRLALVLLTLVALGLRLTGVSYLLPHRSPGDISIAYQSDMIRQDKPERLESETFAKYPLLVAYADQLLPDPLARRADATPRPLADHLRDASMPLLQLRWINTLLGALLVPISWLLARRFVGSGTALIAAFLVAFSLLHVSYSQQERPHASVALFSLMAVLSSMHLARRGGLQAFLVAGALSGVALGALQNGIAVMIPFALAALIRLRKDGPGSWVAAPLAGALVAAGFALFYPTFFATLVPGGNTVHAAADVAVKGERLQVPGHVIGLGLFGLDGLERSLKPMWHYEPGLSLLCLIGSVLFVRSLFRRRKSKRPVPIELWIALAYVLPYLAVVGAYERTHARFLLPAVPYFALLASYALRELYRGAAARWPDKGRLAVGALLGLLFFVPPIALCAAQTHARSAADTGTRAARWLERNTRPGEDRIAVLPGTILPVFESPASMADNPDEGGMSWRAYQRTVPQEAMLGARHDILTLPLHRPQTLRAAKEDSSAYLLGLEADYAVFEVFAKGHNAGVLRELRRKARRHGKLLARISPDRDPNAHDLPLVHDELPRLDMPHYAWRVWNARGFGPVYEIYDLR